MKKKNEIVIPVIPTCQMRIQARKNMIPRGSFVRSVNIRRVVELKSVQTKINSLVNGDENKKSEAYVRYLCLRSKNR